MKPESNSVSFLQKYFHGIATVVRGYLVKDFTYCLHLSILQKLSPVFNDLLTIPHAVIAEATPQGTEENPIRLHGIKQEAFDDFLMWIYKITWTQPTDPGRVYINLLKVCQMWQIDEEEEANNLGVKVYSIIAKACEMLECERKLTTAYPPPMTFDPSWECETHQAVCILIWRDFWWKKVAKQLLHPVKPLAFCDVAEFVERELKGSFVTVERCTCNLPLIRLIR
ncbi:uncharacterized protein LACBIDRAFT_332676 [Laccaria bicolor S238N-H82]|uniref:Predicted protein n=1 Tax=Laccaria bicolor (strain S238N-H82 / ATCC MYA-4686) TaxID=486041 RepID=B0DTI2_LACBS|nr:uncharacterized protein LACBIDRAFT_332676 [Laccaria bicolor S238N-H82]EDR02117.1 predicted protein [Laccaria bicolor S238N-H82]|eukprot:XP_001887274.1 predicted protein [Laccaria bicolor S238N-H82]